MGRVKPILLSVIAVDEAVLTKLLGAPVSKCFDCLSLWPHSSRPTPYALECAAKQLLLKWLETDESKIHVVMCGAAVKRAFKQGDLPWFGDASDGHLTLWSIPRSGGNDEKMRQRASKLLRILAGLDEPKYRTMQELL